jgi:hypothetical protein
VVRLLLGRCFRRGRGLVVVVIVVMIMMAMMMVMMMVMIVMMMGMMRFLRHRSSGRRSGVFGDGDSSEGDGESGGGKQGLDHGNAVLSFLGPERVLRPHTAARRLNSI